MKTVSRNSNCHYPLQERSGNPSFRQSQAGQIVIEYVLLLAIAVSLAVLITKTLIGRNQGEEGFVIQAWEQLIEQIGTDAADDVK